MYLDVYKIEETLNLDNNPCFSNSETYPEFQSELEKFKSRLVQLVDQGASTTF